MAVMVSLRQRTALHEAGHCAAAIAFGVPIIRVTIDANIPHLHRGRYQPQHDAGLECMCELCLFQRKILLRADQ
jgi:hypothetical protein